MSATSSGPDSMYPISVAENQNFACGVHFLLAKIVPKILLKMWDPVTFALQLSLPPSEFQKEHVN